MSVVGIDLGNLNCTVAVARQRGIDVVLNQESKRETPAVVNFGDRQRLIGCAASGSATTNPANFISQFKRLVGRSFSEIQPELPLLPFSVTEGTDGLPLINVKYLGVERSFTPTQLTAMLLSDLKSQAEKHIHGPVVDCCIGIPSFFNDQQRRAILDAARIAGLHPLRLIHETTASALQYGIYKKDLSEKEQLNVAFVDMGHSSMQVCIAGYKKGEVRVLAHASDRCLGGRDFDEVLFLRFAEEFRQKTGKDVLSNRRACARLRAACEKLKKTLSANPEAPLNVECLLNDEDFRGLLKREEFERISEKILERVKRPLREAVESAGIAVEDVQVIELAGSGTRVPAVARIVKEFFGKEPQRTTNASECVAQGCALQCAILSPTFKVREFEIHENFPFNVDILCKGPSTAPTDESTKEAKSYRAFSKGDLIPSTKTLRLSGDSSLSSIELVYADESQLGLPKIISQYKMGPCQITKGKIADFEVEVSLNLHGILSVHSASMVEEYEITKHSPAVPATEASKVVTEQGLHMEVEHSTTTEELGESEPTELETNVLSDKNSETAEIEGSGENRDVSHASEEQVEVVKEKKTTTISISECIHGGVSATNLRKLMEEERDMARQDKLMEETKDRKNEVESYIYDMRDKIHEKYKEFLSDTDREIASKALQDAEDWLYEDGDDATKAIYIGKLEDLKKIGDPIEKRHKEYSDRSLTANQLYYCITSFRNAVVNNDTRLSHIDLADKKKIMDACHEAEAWLQARWQQQNSLPKYANPVVSSEEIAKYTQKLDSYCKKIISKPKQEPPNVTPQDAAKPQQTSGGHQTQTPNVNGNDARNGNTEPHVETVNGQTVPSAPDSSTGH